MIDLAKKYRMRNWPLIKELGRKVAYQEALVSSLPIKRRFAKSFADESAETKRMKRQLERLANQVAPGNADEVLSADPTAREYRRLKRRLAWLEAGRKRLSRQLEKARREAQREAPYLSMDLNGSWECTASDVAVGTMYVTHDRANGRNRLTAKLDRPGPGGEVFITLEGYYLAGRLLGNWQAPKIKTASPDPGFPALPAASVFKALISRDGNRLTFFNTLHHPGVNLDWEHLTCAGTVSLFTLNIPDFMTLVTVPLPPALAELRLAKNSGAIAVNVITPLGKTFEDNFIAYRGRHAFRGTWFRPGPYRVASYGRWNVTVAVGKMTRLTVRPGALGPREFGPDGEIVSTISIYNAASPKLALFRGTYDQDNPHLLAPGKYNVVFEQDGVIRMDGIDVRLGETTPVEVEWSGLYIGTRSGETFVLRGITSDDVVDREGNRFFVRGRQTAIKSRQLILPPGRYRVDAIVDGRLISKPVSLAPGKRSALRFQGEFLSDR
jgi:hypothetical protein